MRNAISWTVIVACLVFASFSAFGQQLDQMGISLPARNITGYTLNANLDLHAERGINYAGFATCTSAGNSYVITAVPSFSALTTGMVVTWFASTNSGAAPYVNVNSLGWKALYEASDLSTIDANDIIENEPVQMIYNGTQFVVFGM